MVLGVTWLAALTASADEMATTDASRQGSMRGEMSRAKLHKPAAGSWSSVPSPISWTSTDLVPTGALRPQATVLRQPSDLLSSDWSASDAYAVGTDFHISEQSTLLASGFENASLFRTRKEMKYRDTLRLLLTKRQLRVWLRDDLHLQCELKRYRSLDDEGREIGLKFGLYYRFE